MNSRKRDKETQEQASVNRSTDAFDESTETDPRSSRDDHADEHLHHPEPGRVEE